MKDYYTRKKQWKPPIKRKEGGKRPHVHYKPEEHGGMPHHQECPHAKDREGRNTTYNEEQHRDVARILAAYSPNTAVESVQKDIAI
jgi:hypothetical protein